MHRNVEAMRAHRPQIAHEFDRVLEEFASQSIQEDHFVPGHGNLNTRQLIGNVQGVTIVDWERLCMAPRALDAATLLGRLRQIPVIRPGRARPMEDLADVFRGEFLRCRGDLDPAELTVYESMALTTRALRAARRPGRLMIGRAVRLLTAARETLERR